MPGNTDKYIPLQPKKIDGKWRYPLNMELPDAAMVCPRCGTKGEKTSQKSPLGKRIFKCPSRDCKVKLFFEQKKAKVAYCTKHKREVTGKMCQGCRLFKQHWQEWKEGGKCPHFIIGNETHPELRPENFVKS